MFRMQYYINYSLKEVSDVVGRIESSLTAENIPREKVFNATLIIEELLVNIIHHNSMNNKLITLVIVADSNDIKITLEDYGHPFNPVKYISKLENTNTRPLTEGGNGLYIVKMLSKCVEYSREDNKNILHLTVLDSV